MLYASNLNIKIREARMGITGFWRVAGSIFRQDRVSVMDRIETNLEIDSDADSELIAAVLRNASNGCHAEAAIKNPTPIQETLRVNGEPFDLGDHPAKTVRRQRD